MTQSRRRLLPITRASGSLHRAEMTQYQRQGKVRVIDGQCLQTDNQSHAVLQLHRDGSQRSTRDARLTIRLVNCASCNGNIELTEQLELTVG